MSFTLDASTILGALGVGFSLASFVMKRMLPLRFLAIGANVAFIGFAIALLLKPDMAFTVPLPGLGSVKAAALLRHFGSVKRIRAASLEQLCEVPGIGPKLAETIKSHLSNGEEQS